MRMLVLASGSGTNLQAILEACRAPGFPAEVAALVANTPGAGALARAEAAGVPAVCVPHRGQPDRRAHERAVLAAVEPHGPFELLVLAGYMRVLTAHMLESFRRPDGQPGVVNIHPADTRAYQGAHGYEFALGLLPGHPERLRETRVTVHFVDDGVDTGPIIAQRPVAVRPDDDLARLRARGLAVEHRLYPEVLAWLAAGRVRLERGRVLVDGREISTGG
jgi:phosphoribosylglycinamide formyltransferase-1